MIRSSWREIRGYLGSQSYQISVLIVIALVSGITEATALLLAVRVAVGISATSDAVEIGRWTLSVSGALIIAAGAEVIATAGHALIARLSAGLSATILRASRRLALHRYVNAPWSIQSVQREGALQEMVTTLTFRTSEVAQYLAFGLAQSIVLSMFIVAALAVDWRFTAGVIVAGGGIVLLLRPVARATQVRARDFVQANSLYAEEVGRLSSASMELKSFGVEPIAERNLERFNRATSRRYYESKFASLFANGMFKDVAVMLLIASVAGLYWFGQEALGSAGVVVALIIRGLASAQMASSAYQNLSESVPNLTALRERLESMQENHQPSGAAQIDGFTRIKFEDVSFAYGDGKRPALRHVSFQIECGDFLGIVGPSGGGKSTLLQLILRLRRPTKGRISLDRLDYSEISLSDWHNFISFVPQEPSLLEGSIADNIAYYRAIPQPQIEDAARNAGIYDEVMALPDGFETRLGPRGSGLSGGQKQRVAIARALAGHPSVLVMDEPTSALDALAEDAILQTIMDLRRTTTIILVAHRMSTVEQCDYLFHVERGTVTKESIKKQLGSDRLQ